MKTLFTPLDCFTIRLSQRSTNFINGTLKNSAKISNCFNAIHFPLCFCNSCIARSFNTELSLKYAIIAIIIVDFNVNIVPLTTKCDINENNLSFGKSYGIPL